MEKKFSGERVVLGAAAFLFCSLGFLACYQSGMALFPDAYGMDMAMVSTAIMPTALVAFLTSLVYVTLDQRLHVRGLMYLTAILTAVASVILGVGSGFSMLALAFAILGVCNGTGTFAVVTEVVSAWFVEKRADKIAFALAAGMIGSAAYQFVGGQVFAAVGLKMGFMILGVVTAVLLVVIAKLMIVGNTPEEVGQVALGAENAPAVEATAESADAAELPTGGPLMKNPVFWFSSLARFLGAGQVMFVVMYATVVFGNAGIELGMAATLISVMTLLAAVFTFVSGKVLGAIGPKAFLALVVICAALDNFVMVLYGANPSMVFLAIIILLYAVGYSAATANNLVIDKLFLPGDLTSANSKLVGMLYAGNCVWLPVSGIVATNFGYPTLYVIMAVLNVAAVACWFLALGIAKGQGIQQ